MLRRWLMQENERHWFGGVRMPRENTAATIAVQCKKNGNAKTNSLLPKINRFFLGSANRRRSSERMRKLILFWWFHLQLNSSMRFWRSFSPARRPKIAVRIKTITDYVMFELNFINYRNKFHLIRLSDWIFDDLKSVCVCVCVSHEAERITIKRETISNEIETTIPWRHLV